MLTKPDYSDTSFITWSHICNLSLSLSLRFSVCRKSDKSQQVTREKSYKRNLKSRRWTAVSLWKRAWPAWRRRSVTVRTRGGFPRVLYMGMTLPLTPLTGMARTRPTKRKAPPPPHHGKNVGGGNSSTRKNVSHRTFFLSCHVSRKKNWEENRANCAAVTENRAKGSVWMCLVFMCYYKFNTFKWGIKHVLRGK